MKPSIWRLFGRRCHEVFTRQTSKTGSRTLDVTMSFFGNQGPRDSKNRTKPGVNVSKWQLFEGFL